MNLESIKNFFATIKFDQLLPVLMLLLICIIAARILMRIIGRMLEHSKLNKTMFTFLKTLIRVILYALIILVIAGSLGIDVSSLITVLGVVSLAITLAVQNTLENVVGGVSLLTSHPFRVGDFVQIDSDCGTVEEITMSYTRIETVDGKHVYIPNRDASFARICNFSDNGKRRIDITVSVAYQDSIDKVKEALHAAAEHPKRLTDEPLEVYINSYLDSRVEYILRLWVLSEHYAEVRFAVLEAVKREFDARGITVPCPQMQIHLDK